MSYDFEKELMRGIPADLAADFFIRIKGTVKEATIEEQFSALSSDEQDEILKLAEAEGLLEKDANMMGGAGPGAMAPPPLAPTGMGKNMTPAPAASLPPTAMGQNAVKIGEAESPLAKAHQRAHEQIEVAHEKHRHSGGERAGKHIGTLLGGLAGGAAGVASKFHHGPAAGAAIGALAGRSLGKDVGASHDVKSFEKKFKHAAAALKLANWETPMTPEGEVGNQPDIHQYLAAEEMGGEAEGANAAEYYKRRFEEATANLQQTQEQADQAQAMADQLQTQVSGSQEQIQAAMQQAQIASESAMSNVQQAHQMAMDATAKAMQSQEQVLQQKQLAAAMKMGITQVKDSVMSALANDPTDQLATQLTSPPPGSGGTAGGAPGVQTAQDPSGAGGMQNASTQAAANGNQETTQSSQGTSGAADQAAGAQGQTNSAGAGENGEEVSDGNSGRSEGPGSDSSSKGTTKVEIKQASLLPPLSLPGALAGGALGAGVGAGYALSGNDALKKKEQELGALKERSFGQSFDLAQTKARLALHEQAQEHPVLTSLGSGLSGAIAGATGAGAGNIPGDLSQAGKNFAEAIRTMKGAA